MLRVYRFSKEAGFELLKRSNCFSLNFASLASGRIALVLDEEDVSLRANVSPVDEGNAVVFNHGKRVDVHYKNTSESLSIFVVGSGEDSTLEFHQIPFGYVPFSWVVEQFDAQLRDETVSSKQGSKSRCCQWSLGTSVLN